jgi:hypothetical protein
MKLLPVLLFMLSFGAAAQSSYEDNASPQDAYSKGYKEGFREGYEQARRDLRGGNNANNAVPVQPKPVAFPITVSLARYGTQHRSCDATRFVARRANGKLTASVDVSNNICGDPSPGDRKSLEITYVCGNRAKTASAFEHRSAYLSCND